MFSQEVITISNTVMRFVILAVVVCGVACWWCAATKKKDIFFSWGIVRIFALLLVPGFVGLILFYMAVIALEVNDPYLFNAMSNAARLYFMCVIAGLGLWFCAMREDNG